MDLKYLTTFQTIVKEGSFRAAAERLAYTQSTITFQIGQLEKEIGVPLFEKVGRKMVLTPAGQEFLPYAEEVLNAVDRMSYFKAGLEGYEGELRIGLAESFLSYKFADVLGGIVKQAPNAKFVIRSMNCYDIRDALIQGDLDMGIFYQDVGGYQDTLTLHPLAECEVAMVASKPLAEEIGDFTEVNRAYSMPFIINEKNCIFRQIFEDYLKERQIGLSHTIEMSSIDTIKKLVVNGVGISFLPKFTIEEELANGNLVEVPTDVTHNKITIALGYHKNKWVSPLMELVRDSLLQL